MADCLIVARKKSATISSPASTTTARFVSLRQRPDKLAAAGETARELIAKPTKRGLEDGPFGGTDIFCGGKQGEKMGESITANLSRTEPKWNAVRIQDFELVQTAHALTQGKLWLPKCEAEDMSITELKNVSNRGLLSRDINGPAPRTRPDKPIPPPLPSPIFPAARSKSPTASPNQPTLTRLSGSTTPNKKLN